MMLYECDWCGDRFDDRAQVASVDITIDGFNEKGHLCAQCAPDHLNTHYPEEREVLADGGWVRQEVRSQRREGQKVDQGGCEHVDGDEPLPCVDCFTGGEE